MAETSSLLAIDSKCTAAAAAVPVTYIETVCSSYLLGTLETLPFFLLLTLFALLQVLIEALLLLPEGLEGCVALVIDDELHGLLPAPVTGHTFGSQQLLESIFGLFLKTPSVCC